MSLEKFRMPSLKDKLASKEAARLELEELKKEELEDQAEKLEEKPEELPKVEIKKARKKKNEHK